MKALELIEGCGGRKVKVKVIEGIGRGGRKVKVIEGIGSHWEDLAVELEVQQEVVDQIKHASHNHHQACCAVLASWLEGNGCEVSWSTLTQCLITAGLPELADNLKETLRLD